MESTEVRRWTVPPKDDELLTLPEIVAYVGLDPTNAEHISAVDGHLWEPEGEPPEDGVERWPVGAIREWITGQEFDVLPGDNDVLDLAGIAEYLQVASTTPQQWRQREVLLPENEATSFPDKPTWRRADVRRWAATSEPLRWPPGVAGRRRP